LNVEKVPRRPQEDDKVAEGVLCRVEVVDSFDVEAFGRTDVLEDFPVGTCWARLVISMVRSKRGTGLFYEHWNRVTKKHAVFRDTV
jgi:hypothetical protein